MRTLSAVMVIAASAILLVAQTARSTGIVLGPPGAPDPSFGNGGFSIANFGGTIDIGRAVAVQPDGKIVVAGYTNVNGSQNEFGVWRGGSTGTSDPSFGNGGYSVANFGGNDIGHAMAVQPDGKIVVAGYTNVNGGLLDFGVWRGGSNGASDPSFGNGGYSVANFGGTTDVGYAVAVQPDGKIVVAGYTNVNGQVDFAVWRGGSNGASDPLFGNGGYSVANFGGSSSDVGQAMVVQPDGKIVVAGYTDVLNGNQLDFGVWRGGSNGASDPSFGDGGYSVASFGGSSDVGQAMALQPDGKIVVAGNTDVNGNQRDFAVWRGGSNGASDPSFGNGGYSIVNFGGTSNDVARAVAVQPDGKIVIAGSSGSSFAAARLQPNGLLDSTFGTGGRVIVPVGGTEDNAYAVALQPDGKIVVAGSTNAIANQSDFAVARLEGDPGVGSGPGGGGPGGVGPPTCAGKPATIVGTQAADTLTGTPQKDVIAGLGGNDVLRALGGNDRICGGAGKDRMFGGRGSDRLTGNAGADRLAGGPGGDNLNGGKGRDRCNGGPGTDKLRSCEVVAG